MTDETRRDGVSGPMAASWCVVVGAATAATLLLAVIGAPSPVLFGTLIGSLVVAVCRPGAPSMPARVSRSGQALLGVSIGADVDPQTLTGFLAHAVPVLVSVLVTVALSILLGQILRVQGVTAATATFAFIAGGASGVTAVAGELGADDRVVAVVQYLRVLIILVGMPVVAGVVFGVPMSEAGVGARDGVGGIVGAVAGAGEDLTVGALVFTVISSVVGLGLARVVPFPAGHLLLPLVVAGVLAVTGLLHPWLGAGSTHLPTLLEAVAFAVIGLQVGLRFTRESLRSVVRVLPLATVVILLLIAASAGVGVVLAHVMGLSPLDGYLATTPGGLYAVLVVATLAGGDVTVVLAVQVVRLGVVLALAPVIATHYRRRAAARGVTLS